MPDPYGAWLCVTWPRFSKTEPKAVDIGSGKLNIGRVITKLSKTIQRALRAKGLTQADLARRMKKSRSLVHALINGEDPRLGTLTNVAEALDTTASELLAGRWRSPKVKPSKASAQQ
jgi:ribosome-binding protein aMBF1 (putative translation factor)